MYYYSNIFTTSLFAVSQFYHSNDFGQLLFYLMCFFCSGTSKYLAPYYKFVMVKNCFRLKKFSWKFRGGKGRGEKEPYSLVILVWASIKGFFRWAYEEFAVSRGTRSKTQLNTPPLNPIKYYKNPYKISKTLLFNEISVQFNFNTNISS